MSKTAEQLDKNVDEKLEKADYVLRDQTPEERERLDTTEDIPEYRIDLDLDQEQEDRLKEMAFLQFEALEEERTQMGLEAKWKERDAQYDGELEANKSIPFNLHMHQSKIKVDAICRAIKEAFLDVEPMVDVSPRPDMERKDGQAVCDRQSEFIDYAMDEEVKPENSLDKIFKCAVKKFVGIGKLCWSYRRERRKRDESYEGTPEGFEQFCNTYPDARNPDAKEYKLYQHYIKRIMRGEKINIVAHYKDTVNNNPELKYIRVEDFYVRNGCNYWEGLRTEHFVAERQKYTYWELKEKQDNGEFKNIEQLYTAQNDGKEDSTSNTQSKDYMVRDYEVIECTMKFKLDESDDEEIKVKAWFEKEKKIFLGCILYPYYALDTEYIPFYPTLNEDGFYGAVKSIMLDVRDTNIAIDVLLNLALYGLYIRNTLTPITYEGSNVEAMFSEKRFEVGNPLILDELTDDIRKGIDFVQWPNMDMNATLAAIEMMKRDQSDVTSASDLNSGRESVLDPTAPASKTMALLEQAGLGIKEYIRTLLPSFNVFCSMILQVYYQMSQEDGKKYKIRRKAEGVTGTDPFASISRDEMLARTRIQARASSFVFDKVNEKIEATANLNVSQTHPYLMQQPEFQFKALKLYFATMGGPWKNLSEQLLSPEEFKKQQTLIAAQAVAAYMAQVYEQAQIKGVPPQVDPNQMAAAITQAQAVAYNPTLAPDAEGKKK